jgi:hypothetical protein
MKFYETSAEDYITAKESWNLHPQLNTALFPKLLRTFEHMIMYGPSGSGKYTQVLSLLKGYSPSELKYEKKMTVQSEKQTYTFRMSDIHYEIDMSFLGCNSKTLWHDIFFQIVDIIAVKADKIGIILCKNFHMIHSELLEIFYSYMQRLTAVSIKFCIITEHISFIPNNILRACAIIPIRKPIKAQMVEMVKKSGRTKERTDSFMKRVSGARPKQTSADVLTSIDTNNLLNLKEIPSFSLIKSPDNLPIDVFNVICDQIIQDMENIGNIPFTQFRDSLYDIMIYNLDVVECVWYIMYYFIQSGRFTSGQCSRVLQKVYPFLQYFNNNYRPIYHLENIMFTMIAILHNDTYVPGESIRSSPNKSKRGSGGGQKGISSISVEISSG